jgi:tRNA U34 2-thiouridine synthase MnmA/TrmU
LCFIGDVPIKEFLAKQFPKKMGDVLDVDGHVVGIHEGAYFYTRGQRHGFQTPMRAYVVDTDVVANTITVVTERENERLLTKCFVVSDWHWVGEERSLPHPTTVKIRYRQPEPV